MAKEHSDKPAPTELAEHKPAPHKRTPRPGGPIIHYIGPTIMTGAKGSKSALVTYGLHWNNGIPAELKELQDKDPNFKMLFVPSDKVAKAIADLQTDTPLRAARAAVAATYKGGI